MKKYLIGGVIGITVLAVLADGLPPTTLTSTGGTVTITTNGINNYNVESSGGSGQAPSATLSNLTAQIQTALNLGGGTNINPSALTGTGKLPYSAYGAIPFTNLDVTGGTWIITNVAHNCIYYTNAVFTNGTAVVGGGPFAASQVGQVVVLGTNAQQTVGTVSSFINSQTISISFTPGLSAANWMMAIGTDDSPTIFTQMSNGWFTANVDNYYFPPGQYLMATWFAAAGNASVFWIPWTNADYVTNAPRTLNIVGSEIPSGINTFFNVNSLPYGNQPPPTNGTIFCCPLTPVSHLASQTNNMIGLSQAPGYAHGGLLQFRLTIENCTFRTFPNCLYSAIDLAYIGSGGLKNVMVDTGIDASYLGQLPTSTISYGIRMPLVNNAAFNEMDNIGVVGYYFAYGIAEHVRAGTLNCWADRTGINFLANHHQNFIARFNCAGCPYHMYNAGVANCTLIGDYDAEIDTASTVFAWQVFVNNFFDTSGTQTGECHFANYNPTVAAYVSLTNNVNPLKGFKFIELAPLVFNPISVTATGYTNTNYFPILVTVLCTATGVTVSNNVPTLQGTANTVYTGPYSTILDFGETITNNSAPMQIRKFGR